MPNTVVDGRLPTLHCSNESAGNVHDNNICIGFDPTDRIVYILPYNPLH